MEGANWPPDRRIATGSNSYMGKSRPVTSADRPRNVSQRHSLFQRVFPACSPERSNLTKLVSSRPSVAVECVDPAEPDARRWRGVQAEHNDRMAKLSDAYAAAYEGDVQFATSPGQRSYLLQRAGRHRKDALFRRATAQKLRSTASGQT